MLNCKDISFCICFVLGIRLDILIIDRLMSDIVIDIIVLADFSSIKIVDEIVTILVYFSGSN